MIFNNGQNFKDCKFINDEMKFFTFDDFCICCGAIKRLYKTKLSPDGKIFYKWYVYANIHMTMIQKNKVWDYLNDNITKEILLRTKRS